MEREEQLTSEESLQLIANMIKNTKENLSKGDGTSFINWGYTSAGVTLGVVVLSMVFETGFGFGFFAIPIIGTLLDRMTRKEAHVKTYADRVISDVWKIIGAAIWMSVVIYGGMAVYRGERFLWAFILPMSIIFTGVGVAITGAVIKEMVVIVLACVGMCMGIGMLATLNNDGIYLNQAIAAIVAFVVGMAIPGHVINRKG